MDTDMALGDDDEAAPSARILDVIIRSREYRRLHERTHPKRIAKFREAREDCLLVVESVMVAPVSVNGYVFAEMD